MPREVGYASPSQAREDHQIRYSQYCQDDPLGPRHLGLTRGRLADKRCSVSMGLQQCEVNEQDYTTKLKLGQWAVRGLVLEPPREEGIPNSTSPDALCAFRRRSGVAASSVAAATGRKRTPDSGEL